MQAGINRLGIPAQLHSSATYRGVPKAPVAVFYGLAQGLRKVLTDYQARGLKAFYIDLGYWGRRKRTRWDGYHKIVLNGRHPTDYFQRRTHSPDRFRELGVKIEPWRKSGRHIIIAGMSAKAAAAEGFQANQWERSAIAKLRKITDRPLIYRPKPNWEGATPLVGSTFQKDVELEDALRNCYAVVTHHSNVGVDALMAGVPVFSTEGVASVLGRTSLKYIEDAVRPDGREQWAADLAHVQWSMDEMKSGACWRYLKDEGLV